MTYELYEEKKLPSGWNGNISGHNKKGQGRTPKRAYTPDIKSAEYQSWFNMLARCYLGSYRHFYCYGGRGIRVYKRWVAGEPGKHGFLCFLEDMGNRPLGYSLGRFGDEGHYIPTNIEWQTPKQQGEERKKKRMAA